MSLLEVDLKKCTRCGLCAVDCVMGVITVDDDGPKAIRDLCIACGHCVAICPTSAINNRLSPRLELQDQRGQTKGKEFDAREFLLSRRSVRIFLDKPVPRSEIEKLLNVARMAPTARNSQNISYLVIDDKKTLKKISAILVEWVESMLENSGELFDFMKSLIYRYRTYNQDVILWNAPCLVLACGDPGKMRSLRDNAVFCLTYAHLYASSLKLGCCWAGLFEACWHSEYKPLRQVLCLPEKLELGGALMTGYAKHKYHCFVERKPLCVSWYEPNTKL